MASSNNPIKVALVDTNSNTVTNLIIVDSLDDPVPDGFVLAPMEYITDLDADKENDALQAILSMIDPNHTPVVRAPIERSIHIGVTRWTPEKKFYEE